LPMSCFSQFCFGFRALYCLCQTRCDNQAALDLRRKAAAGKGPTEIAKALGCSRGAVCKILNGHAGGA
jgi:hypothetical protein